MYCHDVDIVLQEVPGQISVCFSISGCPLHCKGCHSPFLWKEGNGELLTDERYLSILNQYRGYANCVLFMGGEWHPEELTHKLALARDLGFETCLYTGREQVEPEIMSELTWVKTGPWIESLGGLTSPTTNQRFVEVKTNKLYNNHFLTKNM
ncbi:MAG: anaerobic ribonucleoside-triphosphate reductase activating protein [Salinivirgaceae bacterium]|nr:anaerobic ribonucleoside-triphosphate reductase activating protein [Salinivirgaceae bacterium]MBO7432344.1 anaerobic ribonucleoside-triphosphate reductase activating protein [Salinivirgaceae bacterium]MBO7594858.1 anaerobic ribonucleoside-triphosphate reductase activating protein [Salinivirgaceae bacterium]MBR5168830.1 anaerobic ribonucleoside-triphosphate reductase activating protein [Salinivirgaceae bacterium]MBR5956899.1 anaerobic ribonucleoside-triphosphate reductase activating protein [